MTNYNYILLFVLLGVDFIINRILKQMFKIIMGNKNYPLFGKGTRPNNAKTCGFFRPNIKKSHEKSFGMPSGHSQTFAFVATLMCLHIYNKNTEDIKDINNVKDEYKIHKIVILIILTLMAMYMRVYVEKCHTVQQTIIGSLIGVGLAFFFDKYLKNPFKI